MKRQEHPYQHIVSDHAVLRWLERVSGIDVRRQVAEVMLAEGREAAIKVMRNGNIKIAEADAVLVIEAGRVVTVLNASQRRENRHTERHTDDNTPRHKHQPPRHRRFPDEDAM